VVDAAMPAVVVDAAEPPKVEDAGATLVPDARPTPPDPRPVPPRPRMGKVVIVISNPTSDTAITINGVKVGTNRRAEFALPIGTPANVVIKAGGRKTQIHRITPTAGNPTPSRTFELEGDLLKPGQNR
jgi:hypothetical protein